MKRSLNADAEEDEDTDRNRNGIVSISPSAIVNTGGTAILAGLSHEEIIKKLLSSAFRIPIPGYTG
jgi:hypothetical protein